MTDRLLLDFDGTLIDPRQRLYELFTELAPESRFSFDEYWRIKRGRMDQRELLTTYFKYTDQQIREFKTNWMELIEEPVRLATDTAFEGVTDFLRKWSQKKELYLVTARQHPERAIAQIHLFGWKEYFTDIFVTAQLQSKAALIREKLTCTSRDIFVSDTGEDIQAGKELGVRTVAVSSGVLSAEILKEYQPDRILDSVVKLDEA